MAKAGLTSSTFIDALILLLSASTDVETNNLIDQLITCYNEEFKANSSMDTVNNRKFIKLLNDLKKVPMGDENDIVRSKLVIDYINSNQPVDGDDEVFFMSLKQIFDDVNNTKINDKIKNETKQKIKNTLTWTKYRKYVNAIFGKLNKFTDIADTDSQSFLLTDINNIARRIVDNSVANIGNLATGAEERVVFSDKESLRSAFSKLIEEESVGILKTGLQGLNKMCGYRGGFARGEFVMIYGLQHHFKTGMLLTIARGFCKYNDPSTHVKPGKKPLILLISLENYARKNLNWFYKTAYAVCYQKSPDKNMTIEQTVEFVQDWYVKTGWDFVIERYKGKDFGYDQFVNTIERYESLGYEVVACMVDYMEKMNKSSSTFKAGSNKDWSALDNLANDLFGYIKSKEILFISPHQFNRDMFKISEQGKSNVVKSFGTSGVSGALGVAQVADMEISVYIEKDHKGQSWLTVARGKHRYVDNTPTKDKYFAYLFDEQLGILDDVEEKRPRYVRDIYVIDDDEDDKSKKSSKPKTDVF